MREYEIKNQKNYVYDYVDEIPVGLPIISNWRKAKVGEWVTADDDSVIQILRAGEMLHRKKKVRYVGTCTGTFICSATILMDTDKRKNIYSFGGSRNHLDSVKERKNLTAQEAMFAKYMAHGMSPEDAYLKSFSSSNRGYAKVKSGILIKQERIVSAVKEELDKELKELGIDLNYLLKGVKDEADGADRPVDRLKAFSMLWDAAEVIPKNKVTQLTGAIFQGFDDKQLESAKRPELKALDE
jgi:hypothetical protein|tara:strand:- start:380 stop:1102 length:723 start_codon:yes stop_codon:yes gene_type:complete